MSTHVGWRNSTKTLAGPANELAANEHSAAKPQPKRSADGPPSAARSTGSTQTDFQRPCRCRPAADRDGPRSGTDRGRSPSAAFSNGSAQTNLPRPSCCRPAADRDGPRSGKSSRRAKIQTDCSATSAKNCSALRSLRSFAVIKHHERATSPNDRYWQLPVPRLAGVRLVASRPIRPGRPR